MKLLRLQPHSLGYKAQQLLKRAKRAQPAAKRAAPPHQQRDAHKRPQHHRHRVGQQKIAAAPLQQRAGQRGDVDDRQLPLRRPAYKHQRERQVNDAERGETLLRGRQLFLVDECRCEHQQTRYQNCQISLALLPHAQPGGGFAHRLPFGEVGDVHVVRPRHFQARLPRRGTGARQVEFQRDGQGQVQSGAARCRRVGCKQAHHRVRPHTRTLPAHAQAVGVGHRLHVKAFAPLHRDQPGDTPGSGVLPAHHLVPAAIQHGNQSPASLPQRAHLAPAGSVQHIAAHVGQARQHDHHVQRLGVGLQAGLGILPFSRRAVEARLHLAVAAAYRLHQFGSHQLVEAHALELVVWPFVLNRTGFGLVILQVVVFAVDTQAHGCVTQAGIGHLRGGLHHRAVHRHG